MGYECFVKHTFRCLTEEEVGMIQASFFDEGIKVGVLAARYGVCEGTIYRACASIPKSEVSKAALKRMADAMRKRRGAEFELVDDGTGLHVELAEPRTKKKTARTKKPAATPRRGRARDKKKVRVRR